MIKMIIVAFLLIFVILNSCKENSINPILVKPSTRNYSWSIDTLDLLPKENLNFGDIRGNSSKDIWLGTSHATERVGLWHYDGFNWKVVPFPDYAASALCLFEDGTLLVGTLNDKIWKRENDNWIESCNLTFDGYDFITINGMSGISKNNIYAVGWAVNMNTYEYLSVIIHYNGSVWNFVEIPKIIGGFNSITNDKESELYFIAGLNTVDGIIIDTIYKFDGKNIKSVLELPRAIGVSNINGRVYFNSNKIVYKYINNQMGIWQDFSTTDFWSDFVGSDENNFFNNSAYGIGHYNGIDYETIYETDLSVYTKIYIDNELFSTAKKDDKYFIIHGKKNNRF